MQNLDCAEIQIDELWGFINKKQRNVAADDDPTFGDVWTFTAVCADTKIVPCFKVGKRDGATATAFVTDLASRMKNRIQLSSDGLAAYVAAVEEGFGCDVDYGQIVKSYEAGEDNPQRRYSPAKLVSIDKRVIAGEPNMVVISTSYNERLNGTTRHHMKRLARLTLAFSKKFENFEAAVGLNFLYYNFALNHRSLRMTPAMAAGVASTQWTVADIVEMTT
ncbi:MAG: IS1 family transposase [Blastocatellales bacterium]